MTRYSIETRDRIFVKGYGFLFFAKKMSKNTGKNESKNLTGTNSQSVLTMLNDLLQIHLKLLQKKNSKSK